MQVQSYYIQLLHGMNNVLGSERSLDLSKLQFVHMAMQLHWQMV